MRPWCSASRVNTSIFNLLNLVPLLVLAVALKCVRAWDAANAGGIVTALDLVKVDIALYVFLVATIGWVLRIPLPSVLRWPRLLIAQILCILIFLIECGTWLVYRENGLLLDWPLLLFGLERHAILGQLTAARLEGWLMVLMAAALLYLLIVPAWLASTAKAARHVLMSTRTLVVTSAVSGLLLIYFSASPGWSAHSPELARGSVVNLLWSTLNTSFDGPAAIDHTGSAGSDHPFELLRIRAVEQRNIVIVILESTRDRSVDPYADIGVTPYFKALAAESLLARHAYTTTPHTSKALYSIICGQYPRTSNGIPETLEGGIQHACLPKLLHSLGFDSVYFQSATENFEFRRRLVGNMGFEHFYPLETLDTRGYQAGNYFGYEDDIMLPKSREWLQKRKGTGPDSQAKPFLATYLTVSPHFHYDRLDRYGWKDYADDESYNKYLNTLHYQDNFLKNLLNQYRQLGLYQNSVFFVLGDHGQAFREHGLWGHGSILYEETARIPFLIHDPENPRYRSIETPVTILDVLPTALDLQGFIASKPFYPGASLLTPGLPDRDVFLECLTPGYCSAGIEGESQHKLIHNYGRQTDELFDLRNDPLEQRNLIDSPAHVQSADRLRARIKSWVAEVSQKMPREGYDHWGLLRSGTTAIEAPPTMPATGQIRKIPQAPEQAVVSFALSKPAVFSGDSLRLSFYLANPELPVCVRSMTRSVNHHGIRLQYVRPGESAYLGISESLQLFDSIDAFSLKVEVFDVDEASCLARDGVLASFRSPQAVADTALPSRESTDRVSTTENLLGASQLRFELEQGATVLRSVRDTEAGINYRELKADDVDDRAVSLARSYLVQLFTPAKNGQEALGVRAIPELRSREFFASVASFLASIEDDYGHFESAELASAWKPDPMRAYAVYRFKVFFSLGEVLDVRVFVDNNYQINGLFYFHPWKNEFRGPDS